MADAAVAFADLAGFTALTEVHGDEDAADVAERFYGMAKGCLSGDTRLVKPIGDAVMLVGHDPDDTLATVLALAAAVQAKPDFPVLRAGVHLGRVVTRDGDVFGPHVRQPVSLFRARRQRAALGRPGPRIRCAGCTCRPGRRGSVSRLDAPSASARQSAVMPS